MRDRCRSWSRRSIDWPWSRGYACVCAGFFNCSGAGETIARIGTSIIGTFPSIRCRTTADIASRTTRVREAAAGAAPGVTDKTFRHGCPRSTDRRFRRRPACGRGRASRGAGIAGGSCGRRRTVAGRARACGSADASESCRRGLRAGALPGPGAHRARSGAQRVARTGGARGGGPPRLERGACARAGRPVEPP